MNAISVCPLLDSVCVGRHTVQLTEVTVAMVAVTYVDMEARGVALGISSALCRFLKHCSSHCSGIHYVSNSYIPPTSASSQIQGLHMCAATGWKENLGDELL